MDSDSDSNPDSRFLVPIISLSLTSWIRIRIRIQSSWIRIRIQENRGGFGFSWIQIRGAWIRIRIRDARIRTSLVPAHRDKNYVGFRWVLMLTKCIEPGIHRALKGEVLGSRDPKFKEDEIPRSQFQDPKFKWGEIPRSQFFSTGIPRFQIPLSGPYSYMYL